MPGDYLEKYDVASDGAGSMLGTGRSLALATATDVVTTLWNSLPLTPHVSTEDVLGAIDKDALQVYNQNTDTVQALSFVGGLVGNVGLGMKLLGRARDGLTSLGYTENYIGGSFAGTKQKTIATEIEQIFRDSGAATSEYKKASRDLLLSNITKEAIDNAAIELAIMGTMNAHPYMEDYMKDPLKNFAIGAGFGGAIGAGLAYPTTRRAIRELTGPIATTSLNRIAGNEELIAGYKKVDEAFTAAGKYQGETLNVQNLDAIAQNLEEDGITREIATHLRMKASARRDAAFQSALSEAQLAKSSPEEIQMFKDMLSDPRMIGVDKIRIYNLDQAVKETATSIRILGGENKSLIQTLLADGLKMEDIKLISNTFITPDGKAAVAFYRPGTNEIFARNGVKSAALAADLGDVQKFIHVDTKNAVRQAAVPIADTGETSLFKGTSSAQDDARTLKELKLIDAIAPEDLQHVAVAPDDLARLNALSVKSTSVVPEVADAVRIHLRSDIPTFQQTQKFVEQTLGKDYFNKLFKAIEDNKWLNKGLSKDASDLLSDWVHGQGSTGSIKQGQARMRRLVDNIFRGTVLPAGDEKYVNAMRELIATGADTRKALHIIADSEGFVRLYRGLHKDPVGSSSVESFTTRPRTAIGFAGGSEELAKLYKVHVDNVIGSLGSGGLNEAEILVGSPHHEIVGHAGQHEQFLRETPAITEVKIPDAGQTNTVPLSQIPSIHAAETERQVQAMVANKNFSVEEISARLNVKKEAVDWIMAGNTLEDYAQQGGNWRRYTDVNAIEKDYLHPRNKLYAVMGNTNKNQNAEAMANMDARHSRIERTEIIAQMTRLAAGELGNAVLDIYEPRGIQKILDEVLGNIGEINNQRVGGHWLQSADNALRDLIGGPLLTWLGKEIVTAKDAAVKRLINPMATVWLGMRDKPELLTEFNNAINHVQSLKGWKELRTEEASGWTTIVQHDAKGNEVPIVNKDGDIFYIKQQAVIDSLEAMRKPGAELYKLHNLNRSITGKAPLNDIGFWAPSQNYIDRNYAYVVDATGKQGVRTLVASSGPELESLITAFKKGNVANEKTTHIFRKGEQEAHNIELGYTDSVSGIARADIGMEHGGASASAIVPSDTRFLEEMLNSYQNNIMQGMRTYADTYLQDITGWLDNLSSYHKAAIEGTVKSAGKKETAQDSAMQVKNILLGRNQLEQSATLKAMNSTVDLLVNRATTVVNNFFRKANNEIKSKEDFDKLMATHKANGVEPMYDNFNQYLATTRADTKNVSPLLIASGQGTLATMQLRMFENAQAAVNIMSLPILTWASLMEKMPGTTIGTNGEMVKFPIRMMYGGLRHMFSEEGIRIEKQYFEPRNLTRSQVREYTEATAALNGVYQGRDAVDKAIESLSKLQNSNLMSIICKPSDWAEGFTRRFSMHTGFYAAKYHAYPGIDDIGATLAASSFTDRAIGNYHAAQRPTAFQGTLGSMLGLYQTYFLTFAQTIYRGLEDRNFKQLAMLALTQQSLFGMASWPGFNTLSEHIVSHFNDKNYDLTTGTFRAIPNKNMAELVLYGLPSSLGPAFYTRGDISPRVPSTMGEIALVNGIQQGYQSAARIINQTGKGLANGTPVQSLFEALSLQSMNRPIARWSELVTGSSLTQQGNTVSPQNEVWTPMGVTARLLATRPIEEQVVRNARHLDTFYGSLDRERRQAATGELKTAIRDGQLNDSVISETADKYLRHGGTAKGWSAAVNEVLVTTEAGTRAGMLRKLEPDSPIRKMIDEHY